MQLNGPFCHTKKIITSNEHTIKQLKFELQRNFFQQKSKWSSKKHKYKLRLPKWLTFHWKSRSELSVCCDFSFHWSRIDRFPLCYILVCVVLWQSKSRRRLVSYWLTDHGWAKHWSVITYTVLVTFRMSEWGKWSENATVSVGAISKIK